MKRMFWFAAVTAVLFVPLASTLGKENPEEQAVRKMLADRREAFNRHDVKTGCAYYADDADFVNVAGTWWKGKEEIEKNLAKLNAGMFRNSHMNDSETSIRFITPDVAVAHTRWEVTGLVGADGSPQPPRQGIATLLGGENKWEMAG